MKYFLKSKLKIMIEYMILLKSILNIYKSVPGVNRYQPIYKSVNENQELDHVMIDGTV